MLLYLIAGICLGYNAITDWKYRECDTRSFLIAYILLFLITLDIKAVLFFLITAFVTKDLRDMGGGDLDALLFSFFVLGWIGIIRETFIACIISILYYMARPDNRIPFVTMLFIGYIIVILF